MIQLTKLDEPKVLSSNNTKWTSELIDSIKNGQKVPDYIKNHYNHQEIKDTLRTETHDKCMYCESYISAVTPAHIEHYRPKSQYPELTFKWDNLGLACPWCNIKKNDSFDEHCPVINPYFDDPQEHFVSLGTMVCHKPVSDRGHLTELLLELNRPELMESRKNRIDSIRPLIDQYIKATDTYLKTILRKNIEKEAAADKPYSFCITAVIKSMIDLSM